MERSAAYGVGIPVSSNCVAVFMKQAIAVTRIIRSRLRTTAVCALPVETAPVAAYAGIHAWPVANVITCMMGKQ